MAEKRRQNQREDLLIAALATGASVTDAARRAGMSPRTAHRRLDDPNFRKEVRDARGRMVDAALGQLSGVLGDAAVTLQELLKSESDSIRLSSAKSCFELVGKLREQTEFEDRLKVLEDNHAASLASTAEA